MLLMLQSAFFFPRDSLSPRDQCKHIALDPVQHAQDFDLSKGDDL
jgi:hypothetical protein